MRRLVSGLGAVLALVAVPATVSRAATPQAATPATVAPSFATSALSARVTGTSVTATTTVAASPTSTVAAYGICVRSAAGANLDFPKWSNTVLASTGTPFSATGTFVPGTYRYFSCVYAGGSWHNSPAGTFTVAAPVTTHPSGVPMPVGDLPGWHQTFADDFTTPAALGSFPGSAYGSRWTGYDGFGDTTGHGRYSNAKVLSVAGGMLDYWMHTENGVHYVAAPVPDPAGNWGAPQTYGRYSVRFRADSAAGYKTAFLLWPRDDTWAEGEVDYPEGDLDGSFYPASLRPGSVSPPVFEPAVKVAAGTFSAWHTATTEWTPTRVAWFLDGALVASTTAAVPSHPMRWTLQAETSTDEPAPADTTSAHVDIDWVAQYSYVP